MSDNPDSKDNGDETSAQVGAEPPSGTVEKGRPHEVEHSASEEKRPGKKKENAFGRFLGRIDDVILHKRSPALYALLILISTIANVFIAYWQYSNGVENAKSADAQVAMLIANSKTMAESLEDSVTQSTANSRDDRRAWVLPYRISLVSQPEAGKMLAVKIHIKNYGRTPATVELMSRFVLTNGEIDAELTNLTTETDGPTIMAPESFMTIDPKFSGHLTEKGVAAFKAGIAKIMFMGRVIYRDIFGRSHETRFCFYARGDEWNDGAMFVHKKGNTAD